MAAGNFSKCVARILVYEGGNDDDPRDPGGRTSRGILQREYDRWLKATGFANTISSRDVWKAPQDYILRIYRENYWDRLHCEELPAGVDIVVFDGGVNSGVAQQAKWCQRACGIVVDGDFGPATKKAMQSQPDNDLLIADILSRRLAMLQGLKTWKYYGKGWSARVANVKKIGQAWATGSVGPSPVQVVPAGGHRKGRAEDIREPLIPVTATQIGTAAGTVSSMAAETANQLAPISDTLTWLRYGSAALVLIAVVAGVVSTIAAKRAQAAKDGVNKAEVDADADLAFMPADPVKLGDAA